MSVQTSISSYTIYVCVCMYLYSLEIPDVLSLEHECVHLATLKVIRAVVELLHARVQHLRSTTAQRA